MYYSLFVILEILKVSIDEDNDSDNDNDKGKNTLSICRPSSYLVFA